MRRWPESWKTANKKLDIARNVIVALKGDVASAREEVQSLHGELDTARSEARTGIGHDAKAVWKACSHP